MRFSIAIPSCMEGLIYPYPFANPKQIIQISKDAEDMGYEAVWPNDHITTQHYVARMWLTSSDGLPISLLIGSDLK